MRKLLFFTGLLGMLFSCTDDDDGLDPVDVGEARAVIINEGNFGFGNASISLYDEVGRTVAHKVFQANNKGRPIGDVVQSMIEVDDRIYIVVNNSSKIEVVEKRNFKSIGNISPLNSPRYILPISPTKAYVSDLYEDKIYIVNLQNLSITGTIETGGWTEEMALVNNKVFVCHMDSSEVWVINPQNDQVIKKIPTNKSPQHIEQDISNNLWVSCSGGFKEDLAALYKINATTNAVDLVLEASDSSISFGELEMNAAKNRLYYLANEGVYNMSVSSTNLPPNTFVAALNRTFYGLSVDDKTDEVYVCDAIDFQQRGVIYRFNRSGVQMHAFNSGIIPSDIHFLKE